MYKGKDKIDIIGNNNKIQHIRVNNNKNRINIE